MATIRVRVLCFLGAVLAVAAPIAAQEPPLKHDLSEYPDSGPEAVAFSPDGKLLASIRNRGLIRLFDTATGKLLADLDRKAALHSYVADRGLMFSPDGKTLAIGMQSGLDSPGHIILYDVKEGKALERTTTLKGHTAGIRALSFTPDGKTLLSAGLDKEVRLWDLATGKTEHVLRGHRERLLGMALSADGKVLATGDPDEVKVWHLETKKETVSWKVTELVGLDITPDGKTVAVSSFPEGGITFWDSATGKQRANLKAIPDGGSPMAFSPDGKRFVWVNRDRRAVPTVTVTDLATGRALACYTHRGHHMHVVAFSPDGKLLASGDYNEQARAQLLLKDVSNLQPRKGP